MVSFDICEGNPGALSFLMEAYNKFMFHAEVGFQRMQDAGITGDKLYILWNDCLNRNTEATVAVMKKEPIDKIIYHINYDQGYGIRYENPPELRSLTESFES